MLDAAKESHGFVQCRQPCETLPDGRKRDDTLRCTFCGKGQGEVRKLIAGPKVYIRNECIDICNEIITDDGAQSYRRKLGPEHVALSAKAEKGIACSVCRILVPITEAF